MYKNKSRENVGVIDYLENKVGGVGFGDTILEGTLFLKEIRCTILTFAQE